MQIKKTTLTYFDEQEERVRLENKFEGRRKRLLLLILVAFVEGDWTKCFALMHGLGQASFEHMHPFIFDQINAFSGAVLGSISAQRAISGMLPLPDAHMTHENSPRVLPGYPKFEVDTGHGSSLVAVRSPIEE